MLSVRAVEIHYGASQALFGISLEVGAHEVVTVMGRNGMGKTTTVHSILGITPVTSGEIEFEGRRIEAMASFRIGQAGIGLVPEGRQVFPNLTVRENLIATAANRSGSPTPWTLDGVLEMFPALGARLSSMGNLLSGGEQQMLAIGRALMAEPKLLILDEPSLGLAPMLIEQIRDIIVDINKQGVSVLLIEQNAMMALSIADFGYVMESGKVVMDGPAQKLLNDEDVQEFYLGLHGDGGERKSFRDVKHYKRRKRWLS
jgi:branched-chain amino acid transport system ATP-binding protein